MNSLRLPGPLARGTPQLGFGCAYLVPESARLLEVAYEAGIRHFDVGRSYGRGLTESVVGRFARRHTDITLTSKYGIRPPFTHPLHGIARRVLRPAVKLLRRAPAIDQKLDGAVGVANHKASFTAEDAARSLDISLRNLQIERLDLFLMHEAEVGDLRDGRLLEWLRESVHRGRIGAFGIGGEAHRVPALLASRRPFCDVLQHEWSALSPGPGPGPLLSVLYRVFGPAASALRDLEMREPGMLDRCSQIADVDLRPTGVLERLVLSATLQLRPDALVLFSSTRAEHIVANARAAGDAACAAAGRRVIDFLDARQPARLACHG